MTEQAASPKSNGRNWSKRLVTWALVVGGLVLVAFVGAAFIPRWWAHRVGDQANESFTGGIMLGLVYGFLFTVLPIALIVWGIRKRRSVRAWLFIVGGALLLAIPNLFTLGIVLGRNNAAHAGDRTLDVEAPGFRGASLAGALLAVGVVGFVWYLLSSRRRARADLQREKERARMPSRESANLPVGDGDAEDADPDKRQRS